MTATFDLLVIGDAGTEVRSGSLCLRGSAAMMACGAARLGLRVAFAGRIGADPAGAFVRDALTDRGVDTRALVVDPDLPTPLTAPLTSAYDVPAALLRSVRHVHAASFYRLPELAQGLAALFKEARSGRASTSLAPNDDPADRWDRTVLDPVLRLTDQFLPDAAEAHALTGHPVLADAAGILARRGPLVVVKNGADGALAHDGSRILRTAARPVDTAGADSFDAGYVAAVLNGSDRRTALGIAAACGALATRAPGGTAAQPTWDEAVTAGRAT